MINYPNDRNITKQAPRDEDISDDYVCSFYDHKYYYYMFFVGTMSRVPLENDAYSFHHMGEDHVEEFSTTTLNLSTVIESVETVRSQCVTTSISGSIVGQLGSDAINKKVEAGISASKTNQKLTTRTESFTNVTVHSEQKSHTSKRHFTSAINPGYYRFIMLGELDVYAIVIVDKDTKAYDIQFYEVVVAQNYEMDYSLSARWDDGPQYEPLHFDISTQEVNRLAAPTERLPDEAIEPYVYHASVDRGYGKHTIDATYEVAIDDLRLDDYVEYMNGDYLFHFNVEIQMCEVYDGYQEIYLADANQNHVAGIYDYDMGGNTTHKSYDWVTFNWDVSGEKCTSAMWLRYGAHGSLSDDWNRKDVRVTLTITRKA